MWMKNGEELGYQCFEGETDVFWGLLFVHV
jgi:hypothetical protein